MPALIMRAIDEVLASGTAVLAGLLPLVVLSAQGLAAIVHCEKAAIGDGHPMRLLRWVGEHSLGSGKWAMA